MGERDGCSASESVHQQAIRTDLFWQFQGVLQENERLAATNNVFFDWINALFSQAIVMRVRREVDTGDDCIISLDAEASLFAGHHATRHMASVAGASCLLRSGLMASSSTDRSSRLTW